MRVLGQREFSGVIRRIGALVSLQFKMIKDNAPGEEIERIEDEIESLLIVARVLFGKIN
jgi:hypothetical protein